MLPPKLVRRLVLAPLVMVIALAAVALFPLLGLLGVVFGLMTRARPGRMRSLRVWYFALIWLFGEIAAQFMCLGLWIASGFGGRLRTEPFQIRHYALMRWFLDRVYTAATRAFRLKVVVDQEPPAASDPEAPARPMIVLSRHAGPGASFLLVRHLLSEDGRRPRVVMKALLQLDPSVDVVTNRLPNVFVRAGATGERSFVDQIGRLASGLDSADALVIFPEGANWTPNRWERRIRRLEQQGRGDLAARARGMPNLLPPHAGGALAAIEACQDADVTFAAHIGLDQLVSVRDVWRNLPVDEAVQIKLWRVDAGEVPRGSDREAQLSWLYDWWQRMDAWITDSRRGRDEPLAIAGDR